SALRDEPMCGIAGIMSFDGQPVSSEELGSMCAALYHRGPDAEGFYLGKGVGLGMRRLSIIDLKTGRQPVHNEDGTVWVVFNGEIYNFRDLRRDLEQRGHVFSFLSTPLSESIIQGARKLEPGHILIASPDKGILIERYWDLMFEPDYSRSEEYFVERLRELLQESVNLHLVSDVPLGAFL